MTPSSVLLLVLQLCSLQLMAVARPRCWLPGKVMEEAHHQLRQMGGLYPFQCWPYNANTTLPDSVFTDYPTNPSHTACRHVLWVVYESLRESELIFKEHDLPVGEGGVNWDEQKLDKFRNFQDRLVEQDGRCLSGVSSSVVLSSYFSNVTTLVEQQDSAACGWFALRRDLLKVLKSALQDHQDCFN
uniref:Uncharacterized protein n=1 Tax=Stegastes partitus TaxID=144197 RepID=A0A3B5AQA5_9TELE